MSDELNRETVSSANAWQARYESKQAGWERGDVHPALVKWSTSKAIKPPCRIIIPGCGRGQETLYLAEQGCDVTAIDFATAPIEHLREQVAGNSDRVELIQGDIFEFEPMRKFDVVYEQTCLCAIAPERRPAYEQVAYDWLKPGGVLLALFMQTGNANEGPPFHCDLVEMKQLFPQNRWRWEAQGHSKYKHPRGDIHEIAVELAKLPSG